MNLFRIDLYLIHYAHHHIAFPIETHSVVLGFQLPSPENVEFQKETLYFVKMYA